jgi:hypothetical protein
MLKHINEALVFLDKVKNREALGGADFYATGSKLK